MTTEQHLGTYTVLPTTRAELDRAHGQALNLIEALETWTITTDEEAGQAGTLLRQTHDEHKRLDDLRLEAGKPAREAQRDINAFFKPTLDALSEAKGQIKAKLNEHQRAARKAMMDAVAEASEGNAPALARIVPEPKVQGVSYVDELQVNILDFDQIPRKYLCADMSALKILARNGGAAPPGVEFVRVTKSRVGR